MPPKDLENLYSQYVDIDGLNAQSEIAQSSTDVMNRLRQLLGPVASSYYDTLTQVVNTAPPVTSQPVSQNTTGGSSMSRAYDVMTGPEVKGEDVSAKVARFKGLMKDFKYGDDENAAYDVSASKVDEMLEASFGSSGTQSEAYTAVHNFLIDAIEGMDATKVYSKEEVAAHMTTYLERDFHEPYALSEEAMYSLALQIANLAGAQMESCLRGNNSKEAKEKFDSWVKGSMHTLIPLLSSFPLPRREPKE